MKRAAMFSVFSMFSCLPLSFLCILHQTHGSAITFQVTPTEVKDGLTPSLDLSCKVKDTSASSTIVGRRDVIDRRDLTQTTDNVASVTSVIVMHAGRDVASVSSSRPAHVMDGSANTHVTGNVTNGVIGGQGGEGFLHVTITDPGKNHSGEFSCEVNAVSESGHVVTFSTSAEVVVTTPTVADLVTYVREVNKKNEALEKENEDRKKENEDMKKQDEDMQKAIIELKTNIFFSVGLTHPLDYQSGQHVAVYDKIFSNVGGSYDVSSGLFTCGIAGYYKFSISARSGHLGRYYLSLQQNNQNIIAIYGNENYINSGSWESSSNSVIVKVTKGDIVRVVTDGDTHVDSIINQMYTTFSGELVLPD